METKQKPGGRVHVVDDDNDAQPDPSFIASRMNNGIRFSLEKTLSVRNDFEHNNPPSLQNNRLSPKYSYSGGGGVGGGGGGGGDSPKSPKPPSNQNSNKNTPRDREEILNGHDGKLVEAVMGEDYDNEFAGEIFSREELDMKIYWRTMNFGQIIKRIFATIFLTLEVETSSNLARAIAVFTKLVILIAVISYMASTEPSLRVTPNTCETPLCSDDSLLCPGYQTCQDINAPAFDVIENVCVYIFTAEYVLRLISAWAVTPRVAGILPDDWIHKAKDNIDYEQPTYSVFYSTFRFIIKFKNLIDLASICPTYFALFLQGSAKTQFLRILRLLRIIRVLRLLRLLTVLEKVDVAADLIAETMRQSLLLLTVFMFFVVMYIALFGCLIFLLEQGIYTVSDQYPNGEYLRLTSDGAGLEVSPFDSVATGMYWAVGTASGAGDLSPTSHGGRFLANLVEIIGIFGLAFPVGVIGSELDHAKQKWLKKFIKKHEMRRKSMLIEVEKQVISGNASTNNNGNAQRENTALDLMSPPSRRGSVDHEDFHDGHDAYDGSGTQFMLKAILAKLQEDKNASTNLASPTPGVNNANNDDRNSLKSGIRRVSRQQQQQQQQQQPQQSSGETKTDALVPFQPSTGQLWNATEEKDHSMNNHIALMATSSTTNAKTSMMTILDDAPHENVADDHVVHGEKSGLGEDNDDDISHLIRLAEADVLRNREYIKLATEDVNRASVRLESTKRDAQLAVDRLQQLKKLSAQISIIQTNKQHDREMNHDQDSDHPVTHIRPMVSSTSSSSTLATGRKNSQSNHKDQDHNRDHITDGASDTNPKSQQQQQQQQSQSQQQQQSQSQQQQQQQQSKLKKTALGRKRNSSTPDSDHHSVLRQGVGGGAVVLPPLQSSAPIATHHLST